MSKGIVRIYYGEGLGKSTAALGTAIREVAKGKTATVISFLREKNEGAEELSRRLSPELKFFRFEKAEFSFNELSEEEKKEEVMNLRNGFNYGKKVISTSECDVVVLDEVLDLIEKEIITEQAFLDLVALVPDDMVVICTGRFLSAGIRDSVDELYQVSLEK